MNTLKHAEDMFAEHNRRNEERNAELEAMTAETRRLEDRFASLKPVERLDSPFSFYTPTDRDVLLCRMHQNALFIAAAKQSHTEEGTLRHAHALGQLWQTMEYCILLASGVSHKEAFNRAEEAASSLHRAITDQHQRNKEAEAAAAKAAALPGLLKQMQEEDRLRYGV